MKIKVRNLPYKVVKQLPSYEYERPVKQSRFFRNILKIASRKELRDIHFSCDTGLLETIPQEQPCLFLMNHSSFTDLMIVASLLSERQYHIICTDDGFVGKYGLMKRIGCIPTKKFITDAALVRSMKYCIETLGSSIVMYPEASYSFDGTATPLPESIGKLIRLLKVPVVMIRTKGCFLRDPLYNCLQKRATNVSAELSMLVSAEELSFLSVEEINHRIKQAFTFDAFREQSAEGILVTEGFRADGLERVLYRCPHCNCEHTLIGKGTVIRCNNCGKEYLLKENGELACTNDKTIFHYVSDWYRWERDTVRKELEQGTYLLEADVEVLVMKDFNSIYRIGAGRLTHSNNGFHLTACDGELDFYMSPMESYSLYSDYYWYEIGDMICIGNQKERYYCFPTLQSAVDVAKTRLAAEELYKLSRV